MSGAEYLGEWSALPVTEVAALFADAPFRWWVAGGAALELHVGETWRAHGDTDIGILRSDAHMLRSVLAGWDIQVAADGILSQWDGTEPDMAKEENNLWCRETPASTWSLDVLVSDGDDREWVFRRDPMVRVAWDYAVLATPCGVPYLSPELQLLFKSKEPRPKDQLDAERVIPMLRSERLGHLLQLLPSGHVWQDLAPSTPNS